MSSESGDRNVADGGLGPSITPITDSASLADDFFLRAYDDYEHLYPGPSPFRHSKLQSLAARFTSFSSLFSAPIQTPDIRSLVVALAIGMVLGAGLAHWTGPGLTDPIIATKPSRANVESPPLSSTAHSPPARTAADSNTLANTPPLPAAVKAVPVAAEVTHANRAPVMTASARLKPANIASPKSDPRPAPAASAPPIELPRVRTVAQRGMPTPVWQPAPLAPAPARTDATSQPTPTVVNPMPVPVRLPAVKAPVQAGAQPLRRVMPDVLAPSVMIYKDVSLQVQVSLDANGQVRAARLLPPAEHVHQSLIGAAISAARQWTFQPATSGGKAVPSQYVITFRFHAPS